MIRLVVLDFDGTLADTKNLLLRLIEQELRKEGYKLNRKFIHEFGDRPLGEALKMLGVHEKVLPFLVKSFSMNFLQKAKKIKLADDIISLKNLKKNKIILSNNIQEYILASLKFNKIRFFRKVYGANHFKNKYEFFKKLLKNHKINPKQVVYVGDRPIDVALARRIGCISVIVSNEISWSPKSDIIAANPDFIMDGLSELKLIIDKLDS